MLLTCCAYSCTQYGLHTQYMLLTHAADLLCLQLHTVRSAYTVHAADWCCWLAVRTAAHITVCIHGTCWRIAVPTAAHSRVCIHSTCFWPMLLTCCAYSCTKYDLHTHYMLLTSAADLLSLQLQTVRSPYTVQSADRCCAYSCTQYGLRTQYMLLTVAVPTAAQSTVCIHSTCCWPVLLPCCAYSCTHYSLHTQYMLTNWCAYSCTQYGLHTQYMLLTGAVALLCLQLHTLRSAFTVHASTPCWRIAVPTAAHSTVSIHITCCWPVLLTCFAYSCTQYGLHTQYMLLPHADELLCLQLHTVRSP